VLLVAQCTEARIVGRPQSSAPFAFLEYPWLEHELASNKIGESAPLELGRLIQKPATKPVTLAVSAFFSASSSNLARRSSALGP
jgi:hypothetical protein